MRKTNGNVSMGGHLYSVIGFLRLIIRFASIPANRHSLPHDVGPQIFFIVQFTSLFNCPDKQLLGSMLKSDVQFGTFLLCCQPSYES